MDQPPPVPPKDTTYKGHTDVDRTSAAPPSGSKRKRESHNEHSYDPYTVQSDKHTPKKSRTAPRAESHHSDADASDDVAHANPQSLRRKKKIDNLSNLHLGHAARNQAVPSPSRGSKFVEGSLSDKPSEKPPSVFTRVVRTKSGNIQQVDELMSDYHDGVTTPRDSVEMDVSREVALLPLRVNAITAESAKREDNGGFFRFGRSLAANFRPVALWNKLWNESKEELTREHMLEVERKALQKAEAEAKYAQMKQAGQLDLQVVTFPESDAFPSGEDYAPRDSGVVLDSGNTSLDDKHVISGGSHSLAEMNGDVQNFSGREPQGLGPKAGRTLKSRLHFKRPSLSNLKNDLKRVRSDLNLASAVHRESSCSLSPVKDDFENSTLRKSVSKFDLKKQHKLSKRVSNLETKLQLARRELDEALVEASPVPRIGNRYERFTPSGNTATRSKFVPGQLPSLPSERILLAEPLDTDEDIELQQVSRATTSNQRAESNLSEEREDENITVRTARERSYPTHASALFKLSGERIDFASDDPRNAVSDAEPGSQQDESETNEMDPNSFYSGESGYAEPTEPAAYTSLDTKLKALEYQVKATSKKSSKSKKRRAGREEDEKVFKPSDEDDDDAEWEEADKKAKKKRKSGNNNVRDQSGTPSKGTVIKPFPTTKKSKNGTARTTDRSVLNTSEVGRQGMEPEVEELTSDTEPSAEKVTGGPMRDSIDSQAHSLEPLYEEEEDTSQVPLKDFPASPTAVATPATYNRAAVPPRSRSPFKTSTPIEPAAEESLMASAAWAAQQHRGRSSNESTDVTRTVRVTRATVGGGHEVSTSLDSVREEGGAVDQPASPGPQPGFEWPEDVF